jgi:hypothetical protein
VGTGSKTLAGYILRDYDPNHDKSFIEIGTGANLRKVILDPYFDDGDGTVPLESLKNAHTSNILYIPSSRCESADHGSLPKSSCVIDIVKEIVKAENNFQPPVLDQAYFSNTLSNRNQLESTNFILHSDAHLRVTDHFTGASLGLNSDGGIDEDPVVGAFIISNEGEFAALNNNSRLYDVTVSGFRLGEFTLTAVINGTQGVRTYAYQNIPVTNRTTSVFQINPANLLQGVSRMPQLEITSSQGVTFASPVQLKIFNFLLKGKPTAVEVESTSEVSGFSLDEAKRMLSFRVEGVEGTDGSTSLPIGEILEGPYVISIDGLNMNDYEVMTDPITNGDRITIRYPHSIHEIEITGTKVVPEFPFSSLFVFVVLFGIAIFLARKPFKSIMS